ncbi:MAG: SRPBCC domain-containing protein [Steroidobacteraceae bacterium]
MKGLLLFAILIAALAQAGKPLVDARVEAQPDGSRVLIHEVQVPAAIARVWDAFTTDEGFQSWAAPFARVDLRVGGVIESSYQLTASAGDAGNIKNHILAYVPQRMLALQATDAPPNFPYPELLPELFSVVEFEAIDAVNTRIRMYGMGYRADPRHEQLLQMFREANRWTLTQLVRRFETGPVDWRKLLEKPPRTGAKDIPDDH